jgi:DNA processing protein
MEDTASDLRYWIGFNRVQGIGATRLRALLDYFGDLETAWRAPTHDLQQAGLDKRSLANLLRLRAEIDLDAELERVHRLGVTVLTWDDDAYPRNLRQVFNAPPVLYVRGRLDRRDDWAVAVVGTRQVSAYGKEVAHLLAGGLARAGVTVVSGLARGVDAEAHRACLEAGGRTLAVLGSGIDVLYPPQNARLAAEIVEHGAILSEYALGTQPDAVNFPPRNRIVSGLSLGTLIVEADLGSGALITAGFATEQGRSLLAVPGNILARGSRGPHQLIQRGARLVTGVDDVLEELNLTMVSQHAEAQAVLPENETEAVLLRYITSNPLHVDELGRATGLPIAQVTSTLALMELKGAVRQVGSMQYVLAHEGRLPYVVE